MRDPLTILRESKTIAMIGASPKPSRESHGVMHHSSRRATTGFRWAGLRRGARRRCVPTVGEIDEPIDMVDVFRRPEFCAQHAREAVAAGARSLWLQLGIRSPEARSIAEAAGLDYVEDACTAALHARHLRA